MPQDEHREAAAPVYVRVTLGGVGREVGLRYHYHRLDLLVFGDRHELVHGYQRRLGSRRREHAEYLVEIRHRRAYQLVSARQDLVDHYPRRRVEFRALLARGREQQLRVDADDDVVAGEQSDPLMTEHAARLAVENVALRLNSGSSQLFKLRISEPYREYAANAFYDLRIEFEFHITPPAARVQPRARCQPSSPPAWVRGS